jgi:hypothetical protein
MKQRCTNPADAGYHNYGGRGIQFRFNSVLEGALWIMETLGLKRSLQMDRINNDGHYEPGNLRYVTRSQQNLNKRQSVLSESLMAWAAEGSPYSLFTTHRKLRAGLTPDQVIEEAKKAVREKRKNWKSLEEKLAKLGHTTS